MEQSHIINYLLPLLLSGVFITIAHSLLLVRHRANRKWTISEHAVVTQRSLLLYRLSHLITGLLFLCFAWLYFIGEVAMPAFFALSIWIVIFEYLQALLPARGTTNKAHTMCALVMWGSFISLGALCIVLLPAEPVQRVMAALVYVALLSNLLFASRHRERLYISQVGMVILFYAAMTIMVV